MSPILSDLLARLHAAREHTPLTEIAVRAGVPKSTLYKLTRTKGRTASPRIDTVEKLRAYFRDREAA